MLMAKLKKRIDKKLNMICPVRNKLPVKSLGRVGFSRTPFKIADVINPNRCPYSTWTSLLTS